MDEANLAEKADERKTSRQAVYGEHTDVAAV